MESKKEPISAPLIREKRPCIQRRSVDYTAPLVKFLNNRFSVRNIHEARGIQPTAASALDLLPPCAYPHLSASSFNTKFVHVSQNKVRCAINVVLWTPEGRRCITGTASGEFTLWSGTTFSFESILQAHEFGVRAMRFSRNEYYLVSGDESGRIKYWKPNLELLNDAVAHREAVRGLCFSPTDLKFCTCSDDATLKLWDFRKCEVDSILSGHGADVKCTDWHPTKALIASGSKDAHIKLWTPRDGKCISTLYGHKSGINQVWWNRNGNWLLSCSRDQVCKIYDLRMGRELSNFHGHSREVTCCEWHPNHEELFVSGGSDGSIIYWLASQSTPQAKIQNAHDTTIWSVSWHPMGHLLLSGSSDYVTKFWCRMRPGEVWRDRHFAEFVDPVEARPSLKRPIHDNQPISIPGIDNQPPPLPPHHRPPFIKGHEAKRMRFQVHNTSGAQSMESEMESQGETDEAIMGGGMTRRLSQSLSPITSLQSSVRLPASFKIPHMNQHQHQH